MSPTAIEWTEETWNPMTGCDRISPGCDNCYALRLAARLKAMGQEKYQRDGDPRTSGPGFGLTLHPDVLELPLRWARPRRVFVNSMSDLFHPGVPDEFVDRVFGVMASAKRHTFQVLTKRPQRARAFLAPEWIDKDRGRSRQGAVQCEVDYRWARGELPDRVMAWPLPNVWLGTSIENDRYCFRADHLRATPAAVRFLSLEPLPSLDLTGIDWVIVGGESGPGARPIDVGWVRYLLARCADVGVAPFVKQLGTVWSVENGHGRTHGGDWTLWPEDLRIRELPGAKS